MPCCRLGASSGRADTVHVVCNECWAGCSEGMVAEKYYISPESDAMPKAVWTSPKLSLGAVRALVCPLRSVRAPIYVLGRLSSNEDLERTFMRDRLHGRRRTPRGRAMVISVKTG